VFFSPEDWKGKDVETRCIWGGDRRANREKGFRRYGGGYKTQKISCKYPKIQRYDLGGWGGTGKRLDGGRGSI